MNNHYDHWKNVPAGSWPWVNFTPAEMADSKSGKLLFVPEFMDLLQCLRATLGVPMPVNSGYRTWEHDKAIKGAGVHPLGVAADIGISGDNAYHLIRLAPALGFRGIGIKQHGPHKRRFIHLDTIDDDGHPRPRIWTYT